jgi:hypothetical protein
MFRISWSALRRPLKVKARRVRTTALLYRWECSPRMQRFDKGCFRATDRMLERKSTRPASKWHTMLQTGKLPAY